MQLTYLVFIYCWGQYSDHHIIQCFHCFHLLLSYCYSVLHWYNMLKHFHIICMVLVSLYLDCSPHTYHVILCKGSFSCRSIVILSDNSLVFVLLAFFVISVKQGVRGHCFNFLNWSPPFWKMREGGRSEPAFALHLWNHIGSRYQVGISSTSSSLVSSSCSS